jgi:predicted membrane channel-forming protein YqfA (hemolysin III family)
MRIMVRVPAPPMTGSSSSRSKMTVTKWVFLAIVAVIFIALGYGIVQDSSSIPSPWNENWVIVIYLAVLALLYFAVARMTYDFK